MCLLGVHSWHSHSCSPYLTKDTGHYSVYCLTYKYFIFTVLCALHMKNWDCNSCVILAYVGRTVHHSFLQGSLYLITCQHGCME